MARAASIGDARRRLPRQFIETLSATFPQPVAERILRGMGAGRLTTLRVNTLRATAADVLEFFRRAGVRHRRVTWYPDAFVLVDLTERDAQGWDLYAEGRIYLQGLSSMIPALVLAPAPGEKVLDIAAAPGSKTTQMAALMGNAGTILANELDGVRAERLAYNLRLQGATIAGVRVGRGEKLGAEMPAAFDRVLLDVPCSGEGRFIVFEPASSRAWSPRLVSECARLQKRLLAAGAAAVRPGGILVYSTCTLNRDENELAIQWALENLPLEVDRIPLPIPGSFAGMARGLDPRVAGALRVFPDQEREGFFVCRLRRTG
jgi:NOL1/NOP2/sun family putative RNA methylase